MTAEAIGPALEAPKPRRKVVDPSHVCKMALQANSDSKRWFPETAEDLTFMVLALCGEVGELANEIKKIVRGSANIKEAKTRVALMMEEADVFTYLLCISILTGTDLEKAYYAKRAENERRFGKSDD